MASVDGIGGVFVESENADRLAQWYEQMLGIQMESHPNGIGYYHVFFTRDVETSILRENPVFAINHTMGDLAERDRGFTINFRVDDLDPFLDSIRSRGVQVEDNILEWERGKHAWIHDPDGNRIELYEEILPDEG